MSRKLALSSHDSYLFHMSSPAPRGTRYSDTPTWEAARITSPHQPCSDSLPSETTRQDSLKASQSENTAGHVATEARSTPPGFLSARNIATPPSTPQLNHGSTGSKRISQLVCGVSPPRAPSILSNLHWGLSRTSPSPENSSAHPTDTVLSNEHTHSPGESAHFLRICGTHYGPPIPRTVAPGFPDAGRGYYVCALGCFLGWGDKIGVYPGNPKCFCGLLSRAEKGGLECANEYWNCGYRRVIPARGEDVVNGNEKEVSSEAKQEQAQSDISEEMCWVEGRWVRWK